MTVILHRLTKRYGATLALDGVDLEIRSGEVHALLGHNGAGKSTLIRCLGGGTPPSSGTIEINGEVHHALDPRGAIAAGVAVIYQHLSLIGTLTVAENLFLGQEIVRIGLLRRARQRELARAALARVGLGVPVDRIVDELSLGQRQQVEIAKALRRDARLLVLDEPTAALSPHEAKDLARLIDDLRRAGIAILYVTHLLDEVMRLADRVTVLKDGRSVWAAEMRDVTKDQLVRAISAGMPERRVRTPIDPRVPPRLEVRELHAPGLSKISFAVRPGEIVCLYGLAGSGRTRLLETIFGRRRRTSGEVRVDRVPLALAHPAAALAAWIALVPADRRVQGLFGTLSAVGNTVVRVSSTIGPGIFRSRRAELRVFAEVAEATALRPALPTFTASQFSGGNQQKLLIGRWISDAAGVRVLLLDDPTQGVDVGARAEIYRAVRRLADDRGVAVVFATNEPEEVLVLADRCLVLSHGRLVTDVDTSNLDEEQLLSLIHAGSPTAIPGVPS